MAIVTGLNEQIIAALEAAGIIADRNYTRRVTLVIDFAEPVTATVEQYTEEGDVEKIVKLLKVVPADQV